MTRWARAGLSRRNRWQTEHRNRQIVPHRIIALDQLDLPVAFPFLDALFADDGVAHVFEAFDMDEPVDAILLGEARDQPVAVLDDACGKVACDAGVERSMKAAGQ